MINALLLIGYLTLGSVELGNHHRPIASESSIIFADSPLKILCPFALKYIRIGQCSSEHHSGPTRFKLFNFFIGQRLFGTGLSGSPRTKNNDRTRWRAGANVGLCQNVSTLCTTLVAETGNNSQSCCWCVARVGELGKDFCFITFEDELAPRDTDISASLNLANFTGNGDGGTRGLSRPTSLHGHNHSGVSGPPRVLRSFYNSEESNEREDNSSQSCEKHAFCPKGHTHLGIKIASLAILMPLTLYLVFLGYEVADRGLDAFERGRWVYGGWLMLCAIVVACGSAFFLPLGGYWFVFENGVETLLGVP